MYRLIIYNELCKYVKNDFMSQGFHNTSTYSTMLLVSTLSLIRFYLQRANIQYFHRVEQSPLYPTVSWNFYNSYKHISRHRTA